MSVIIDCQGFESGDAFKHHAENSLEAIATKYANKVDSLNVYATKIPLGFKVQIRLSLPRKKHLQAEGESDIAKKAFNNALVRIGKQLRRLNRYSDDRKKGRIY